MQLRRSAIVDVAAVVGVVAMARDGLVVVLA
jgi:hypothetical protein